MNDNSKSSRKAEEEAAYKTQKMLYCKHCLSLMIIDGGITDYCEDCYSADIGCATLEEYDKLYFAKYGKTKFKR